jgi:predicted esterase
MSGHPLGFQHRFVPSSSGRIGERATLLLLHGTGGNEDDLLPLGAELMPEANLLSPRGSVLENGMPRFFRRLAEGVFDLEDLRRRTDELAAFVGAAARTYGFDAGQVTAAGFSNGANIAASLLLLRPKTLASAVLFRAMVPLDPGTPPDLARKQIFLSEGLLDPIVPRENAERLAEMFRAAGADVTLRWRRTGHGLTQDDVDEARDWLAEG